MRSSTPPSTRPTEPKTGGGADRRRHDRRRLGEPVALGDAQPEALLEPLGDADRQLGGARQGEADAGERVGRRLLEVGEGDPHRRRPGMTETSAGLDRLEGRRRVEPLHEHDGGPVRQAHREHHVEPEDVVERDDAVDDVAGRHAAGDRPRLLDVGEQVAVGQHRGARRAGRAAREQQRGEVVGRHVDGRQRLGGQEVLDRDRPVAGVAVDGHDGAHGRHRARDRRPPTPRPRCDRRRRPGRRRRRARAAARAPDWPG